MNDRPEQRRRGIGVSPGIAIGRAFLAGKDSLKAPHHAIEADDVATETARITKAVSASDKQLEKVKVQLASADESDYHIISAHQLMLRDEHLVDAAVDYIRSELICAEWALQKAVEDISAIFEAVDDEYLRERKSDVQFVFERLLRNLLGRETGPLAPPPDAIVVAYDLSPADTAQLHKAAVAGLLTDGGGKTSHTAIIARAHEIPAIVGLESITELIETDDLIVMDGERGEVIVHPTAQTVARYRDEQKKRTVLGQELLRNRDLPAITKCGQPIGLHANLDDAGEVEGALAHGATGVGLVRTEYLFMRSEEVPSEEMHYQMACAVLIAMGDRPVTLRTFDLGADKLARFLEEEGLDEANPALGLRSIRLCLSPLGKPLFRAQLRGLLRAAVLYPSVRLMLPMITTLEELTLARAEVHSVADELRGEGVAVPNVPLGIMVETPAAALMAETFAAHADFFSIGTNDLIQYTMAVDRVNENVSYLYESLHPAHLRLLREIVQAARRMGKPVTLCGEMAGDERLIPILLGLGVWGLSMSPVSLPAVKQIVRAVTLVDCQALVHECLRQPTATRVREELNEFLTRHRLG